MATQNTLDAKVNDTRKGCPRLEEGEISAAVIATFQAAVNQHICEKWTSFSEAQRISAIISTQHPNMRFMSWVTSQRDKWTSDETFTVAKLWDSMRNTFLPVGWDLLIKRKMLHAHMSDTETVSAYHHRVSSANMLFVGTPNYLPEAELLKIMDAGLSDEIVTWLYLPHNAVLLKQLDILKSPENPQQQQWVAHVKGIQEFLWNSRNYRPDGNSSKRSFDSQQSTNLPDNAQTSSVPKRFRTSESSQSFIGAVCAATNPNSIPLQPSSRAQGSQPFVSNASSAFPSRRPNFNVPAAIREERSKHYYAAWKAEGIPFAPAITEEEREMLKLCDGCYRCSCYLTSHIR